MACSYPPGIKVTGMEKYIFNLLMTSGSDIIMGNAVYVYITCGCNGF